MVVRQFLLYIAAIIWFYIMYGAELGGKMGATLAIVQLVISTLLAVWWRFSIVKWVKHFKDYEIQLATYNKMNE